MTKPVIIGFGHRKRSGKDTVGQYLVNQYKFKKLSFADPLKQAAKLICGFSDEQCYGSDIDKETTDPYWGFSPRWFMQRFGTEVGRAIDSDLWVKAMLRQAQKIPSVVVCDVRFPNEAKAIRDQGGLVIRVDRPSLGPLTDTHPSETSLEGFEYDDVIVNDGSLEDLYDKVDEFMFNRFVKKQA